MTDTIPYIRGSRLAEALGVDKKTVHSRALREQWPMKKDANRFAYQPPVEVAALCGEGTPGEGTRPTTEESPRVKFSDLAPDSRGRLTALRRQESVQLVESIMALGRETARRQTVSMMVVRYTDFNISTRSLLRWETDYAKWGLDGLVEQKQGASGRKGVIVPAEFIAKGKAKVIEHGSIARAARELMTDPELPAAMRAKLHEGHGSKSYVTPSIRNAIRPAELTKQLAQGPRHARLNGRFTPGDYSKVKAGDVFVSDDMTSNCYCWVECPGPIGWRVCKPQILPVLDVGSLRWINVRVIAREGGQYSSDDIWGLFGDTFDLVGLPRQGFVLEGGHWQAKKVVGQPFDSMTRSGQGHNVGHRTGLSDDERMGGLASLGLTAFRWYDPRSKIIETAFNQLQYVMDAFPGYAGRDERFSMPEAFKKKLAAVQAKNPIMHPKEFLPHISQLADHVRASMEKLNLERNDGVILRGGCATDKWMEEAAGLTQLPDSAKWMYRSAMNPVVVTKNGVRITQGTGKKMLVYYYDNPALLTPLQGQTVVVYWNHNNPDADACIMAGTNGTRKFVGLASRVQALDRFGATEDQLEAESDRKKQAMHFSRTELRSIQPEMVRRTVPVPVGEAAVNIGEEINQAAERAVLRQAQDDNLKRIENKFKARAAKAADEELEDGSLKLGARTAEPLAGISMAELDEL